MRLSLCSGNFYGSEIRHGIFRGLNFGPVIFGGFVWSPWDFFGFDFWLFRSSLSLEIRSIHPPGLPVGWLAQLVECCSAHDRRGQGFESCTSLNSVLKLLFFAAAKADVIVLKLTIGTVGIFLKFVCSNLGNYLPPIHSAGGRGGVNLHPWILTAICTIPKAGILLLAPRIDIYGLATRHSSRP